MQECLWIEITIFLQHSALLVCFDFEISVCQAWIQSLVQAEFGSCTEGALAGRRKCCLAENPFPGRVWSILIV